MEKSIELDCPPGSIRPGHLIGDVIKDLGLEHKKPISTFFGCWKWEFSEVPDKKWKEIQPILQRRITSLYNKGLIRYGSW